MRSKRLLHMSIMLLCTLFLALGLPIHPPETVREAEVEDRLLTVMCYYEEPTQQQMLKRLCVKFSQENPGVQAVPVFLPYENYVKRLLLHDSQGTAQDLLIVENADMPALIKMGLFEDITSFVEERSSGLDMYPQILRGNLMENGRYYGQPFTCTSYALYCNLELLEPYALTPPETWEELKRMAKKLTLSSVPSLGLSLRRTEQGMSQFLQFFSMTGASLSALNGADGIRAFQLLDFMMRDGTLAPESLRWSENDLRRQFSKGKVAMMLNTCAQLPLLQSEADFRWSATLVPIDKKRASVVSGENIGVAKDCMSRDTLAFLEYLGQGETVRWVAEEYGSIPIRMDVLANMRGENPLMDEVFYSQMEYAQPKGSYSTWIDSSLAVTQNLFEMLTQTDSVSQAALDAQILVSDYIIMG